MGYVDVPKLPGDRWRRLINDPVECGFTSIKYRNLLPVVDNKLRDDAEAKVIGLYFKHQLIALRVFNTCCVCVISATALCIYMAKTSDTATAFTVGAYILAAISVFLAVLAIVVAVTR